MLYASLTGLPYATPHFRHSFQRKRFQFVHHNYTLEAIATNIKTIRYIPCRKVPTFV